MPRENKQGQARLRCGKCSAEGGEFRYAKSHSNGLISVECLDCNAFTRVAPPVLIVTAAGEEIVLKHVDDDVERKNSPSTVDEGFVTVSLRVPKSVRDRFVEGVKKGRQIHGINEKGIYSATVFEFMVEEWLQTYGDKVVAEVVDQPKTDAGPDVDLDDDGGEDQ